MTVSCPLAAITLIGQFVEERRITAEEAAILNAAINRGDLRDRDGSSIVDRPERRSRRRIVLDRRVKFPGHAGDRA